MQHKLPFFTLLLLISFASVNAVLFTPALPNIVTFFKINDDTAQLTITLFLVGYALGQLLYGPIANRFGRKRALYAGISLQIASSLLCALSGPFQQYTLLIIGRFLLALGSGVGLKMTYTLVNDCYDAKKASQTISYLMLAFAFTPGLGIALGGVLNSYYGWGSCFYAGAIYGFILLSLVMRLPETQNNLNLDALKIKHLLHQYRSQFKNKYLITGAFLMGCSTSFVYIFATLSPFVAINLFGMNSSEYGFANIIPPIGLIFGSIVGARIVKILSLHSIILLGISISTVGTIGMLTAFLLNFPIIYSLFISMMLIYFGLCFIMANAAAIAMSEVTDKAHGAAVMSFINMGFTTLMVLTVGLFPIKPLLLPIIFLLLSIAMLTILIVSNIYNPK